MVREDNAKLMSKLAIYEKHKGKQEIALSGYYKSDYVRMNILKSIVSATVTFLIVMAVIAFYKLDYILANIFKLDYEKLGLGILLIYIVWVLIYWLVARVLYAWRYEKARPNIIEYNHNLKKLQEARDREVLKKMKGVVINDDFIDF